MLTTLAPSDSSFSAVYVATLPEPEMATFLPASSMPRVLSMLRRKYTLP